MRRILDFPEIDELFRKYKQASFLPNNEEFVKTQKNLIVEELWRNLKEKSVSTKIEEYPDEMVKTANDCIKKYIEKGEHFGFSAYTFVAIKNRLATCAQNASFNDKTGGMHVSDGYRLVHNKLNRLYKYFLSLRKSQETESVVQEKFIKYATTYLEVERADVIDFLAPKESSAIEMSKNGEVFDITDFFGSSDDYSPENEIINVEKSKNTLKRIEYEWETLKQDAKPLMSELLTLIVLDSVEKGFIKTGRQDSLKKMLSCYHFICGEMLAKIIKGKNQPLPTQQEIGKKYGLTKSGVSKKLSRFFEKIKFAQFCQL